MSLAMSSMLSMVAYGQNLCLSAPCLNGGLCNSFQDTYTCMCPEGFTGETCEFAFAVDPSTVSFLGLMRSTRMGSGGGSGEGGTTVEVVFSASDSPSISSTHSDNIVQPSIPSCQMVDSTGTVPPATRVHSVATLTSSLGLDAPGTW